MMHLTHLRKQVEQQFEYGTVWQGRDFVYPHDGLVQSIRQASPATRADYAEVIRQLLWSDDLRHRTGAIAVLDEVMPPLTAAEVLANLEQPPQQAPAWPIGDKDLEQSVAITLASNATQDDINTLEWLKTLSLERDYAVFLWCHLARLDSAWTVAHAQHVNHSTLAVIAALPEVDRENYIKAKAPWPEEEPSVLTKAFWKQLPPQEAARLRALMYPEKVFVYQIGNEYASDDPVGLETLTLVSDGTLSYRRRQRGQQWQAQTKIEASAQQTLTTALEAIDVSTFLERNLTPGAAVVQLEYQGNAAIIDYYYAKTLASYGKVIRQMDVYLNELRDISEFVIAPKLQDDET
ncbi:MAG: hypothetical protein AAF267_05750 [Deinococcota bacterium]